MKINNTKVFINKLKIEDYATTKVGHYKVTITINSSIPNNSTNFQQISIINNETIVIPYTEIKDNKLVLTSVTGKQSWELDKRSIVYRDKEWGEEKDEVIRYWKRVE